jgi:tetratricopeptide (TPR) repeat protein
MNMKRTREQTLEYESELALRKLLPPQWVVRSRRDPDIAIDLEVEIVEGENVTNKVVWLQIKATESIKSAHRKASYQMETKHLKYYEKCHLPVVILYWVKLENIFYYLFAQRYMQEELSVKNPKWRAKKTATIGFSSDSKLKDSQTLTSIATEGYFYIIQRELNTWLDGIPKSLNKELKERTLKALLYMDNEKYRPAIEELEDILRICTPSFTERIALLLNLGNAYYSLSRNKEALKNYNAILKLTKNVNEEDALEGKASALGNIGLIYKAKGDLDQALKYYQEALEIDKEISFRQGEANQLGNIGLIYKAQGDLDQALNIFQDILEIHREIGHREGEANDLGNIGNVYYLKGDLDQALKYQKEALKIDKEIGFREGEASDLGNIGVIYRAKGDLDQALKYLEEALKIHKEIGYRQGEASDLGNIGLIYQDKGDLDQALKNQKEALEIDKEMGFREGEANSLGNIGLIYQAKGDLDQALKYMNDTLKIFEEIGMPEQIGIMKRNIERISQQMKQMKKSNDE